MLIVVKATIIKQNKPVIFMTQYSKKTWSQHYRSANFW